MKYVLVIVLLVLSLCSMAQDSHYWTTQFGTRSALLSGAVVGGYNSNTMVFYNPGALGMIDSSSFSINASLYQLEFISIRNQSELNYDIKGSQFDNIPLMFSGTLRSKKNTNLRYGYGIMTPTSFTFHGAVYDEGLADIVDDNISAGPENYTSQVGIDSRIQETLFMAGAGYRIDEYFAIGATLGLTIRTHRLDHTFLTRIILNDGIDPPTPESVTADLLTNMFYFQGRMRLKLGWNYSKNNNSIGITFTSPSLTLYSQGKVYGDFTITNVYYQDSILINLVASGDQRKLPARYKTPWALAAGYTHHWANSSIFFTVEYFDKLKIYKIIEADPVDFTYPRDIIQEIGIDTALSVFSAARPVFNFALGYEKHLSPSFSLMTGFRANNSYYDSAVEGLVGISTVTTAWNIYYLTAGGRFSNERNDLMVGIQLGYGKSTKYTKPDQYDGIEERILLGINDYGAGQYFNVGFVFGWNYIFLNSPKNKKSKE